MKVKRIQHELDAVQWTGENIEEIRETVGPVAVYFLAARDIGDWLVKDQNGYVSVWPPEMFGRFFEPVSTVH